MKKRQSWHHLPHPGPDPERSRTIREALQEAGGGILLMLSQGRLPPKPVPRTHDQLIEELSEMFVHAEVFRRSWWALRPELRDRFWRLLDILYRDGGVSAMAGLPEKPAHDDLSELEHAGLLFCLPSTARPETLVFPYEYFFMPDMPGTGPQSLCQGLRHYSDAGARILAAELGMREPLPRASALALLHRKLIANAGRLTGNLPPAATSLLDRVAARGGVLSARALSDSLAALRPDWSLRIPLAADDLAGARFNVNSPAHLLARRALLIPCGEPGWSAFPQVCIPMELRDEAVGPAIARARTALAAERARLGEALPSAEPDERPGQFAANLRRLALVAQVERMKPGKDARLPRSDRKRLETLLHLDDAEVEALLEFAARRGGEAEPLGGAALDAFLAMGAAEQTRALAEDFLGRGGWLRSARERLLDVLGGIGARYAGADVLARHLLKDPAMLGAYEAALHGEPGPRDEAWIRSRVAADLRALHRTGFLERATGAAHDSYRLASGQAWALSGKKAPATARRAPVTSRPEEAGIAVLPTLEILAPPSVGAPTLEEIARFARLERADAAFVFRIDRRSLAAGVGSGLSADAVREFLVSLSRNPLPDTLRVLLGDLEGGPTVSVDPKARSLRSTDAMVLLRLRRVKWLKRWIVEGGPDGSVRLHPECDLESIAARLAGEGFVVNA
jgi:hypothetical protein